MGLFRDIDRLDDTIIDAFEAFDWLETKDMVKLGKRYGDKVTAITWKRRCKRGEIKGAKKIARRWVIKKCDFIKLYK